MSRLLCLTELLRLAGHRRTASPAARRSAGSALSLPGFSPHPYSPPRLPGKHLIVVTFMRVAHAIYHDHGSVWVPPVAQASALACRCTS